MRSTMLVEVESFFGDRLVSGEKYSLAELRKKVKIAIRRAKMTNEDFTTTFCRMYQFEEQPHTNDTRVDFVIDLDVYYVYPPCY